MHFRTWFHEQEEPDLSYLLNPPGAVPQIGEETGEPVNHGIVRYDSPYGSYRYVYYLDGQAVSALQIVSRDKRSGAKVANVFTHPNFRRQQLATQLFQRAQSDFGNIQHQPRGERSDLANRWIDDLDAPHNK
jgi:GNAT superfamily N-acetyltransferase